MLAADADAAALMTWPRIINHEFRRGDLSINDGTPNNCIGLPGKIYRVFSASLISLCLKITSCLFSNDPETIFIHW